MKKSYFFVSATLVALIFILVIAILAFAIGYRFETMTVANYGRVTYYGKTTGGTVYLAKMTAKYDKAAKSLMFSNEDSYIGEIEHYLPNGVGVYTYASGDSYTGEMTNGLPNGEGVYTFANGDTFEGTFDNGAFSDGTLTVSQKGTTQRVTGHFEKSNFSGNLSYLFLDGAYYVGGYHNGLPSGQGKVVLANGDSYEGSFREGCFEGLGTYTFADGSVLLCLFEKGVPRGTGSYAYVENGIQKSISGQFFDGYFVLESES